MPLWLWLVDSLALVVVLAVMLLTALVVRRRHLARRGGAFDLSINRREGETAKGWTLGVAAYHGNTLEWYRTFSFRWRPTLRLQRGHVVVEGRRDPVGAEVHAVHSGHVIVQTQNAVGVRQLSLSPDALTGLLAWLESSPPGQSVNTVL